jgi:AcrR family transcriptional regulator
MAQQRARARRPSREEVADRLVEAAGEVLAEVGFEASVEEITERAGFSRGAFYSNYRTKEQLFLEALQRRTRERVEDLERDLADSRDLPELLQLVTTGRRRNRSRREFSNYMQLYFHCLAQPELCDHLAAMEATRQQLFADAAARLLTQLGVTTPAPDVLGRTLSALDHGLAIQTYLSGRRTPLDIAGVLASVAPVTIR